ncbi:uncharacterized protein LOC125200159 [Salvia hispanica]|uniref:uncharacterized protein LOC125200159 n=1 Tax=Salvia hispanica TaxID=49212 RepID=UPI002009A600|nr:uncharacterized protein LOC125200159 [Salvia hispanica]
MHHSSTPISPRASPTPPPSPHQPPLAPPLQPTEFTCHNCNQIVGLPSINVLTLAAIIDSPVVRFAAQDQAQKPQARLDAHQAKGLLLFNLWRMQHKHESESEPETDPEKEKLTLSYLCSLCGYWIHPDCASLLNALHYKHHRHSLFLIYNLPTSPHSKCFICFQLHKATSGVFVCLKCTNYLVHINCAVQDPHTFKPVLMRDAKACDLGRLPMANEHTSLIPYIRHDISSDGDGDDDDGGDSDPSKIHEHPLIFHENFFLHECCARLPALITHPAHAEHILVLHSKAPKTGFSCRGCHLRCNGFAYSCETCDDFTLDVVCGLINPAITHEPHKSTHILFMSRSMIIDDKCSCCNSILNGICYECSSCPSFKLHVRCALLPKTVSHDYDQHPLG